MTNVLQGHSNNFHTRASYFVTQVTYRYLYQKFMRYMKNPDSHEIIEKFLAQLKTRNGDELSHFYKFMMVGTWLIYSKLSSLLLSIHMIR